MSGKGKREALLKVRNAEYYGEQAKAVRKAAPRNKDAGDVGFSRGLKNGAGITDHKGVGDGSVVLQVLGCESCSWCDTKLCPHFGDVTRKKFHSNKICGERVKLGVFLHEEGHKITFKKLLWLKQAVEADKIAQHLTKEAMDERVRFSDVYPWKKLIVEAMSQFIKHEEVNKPLADKIVNPSDFADALDKARSRVVDAEVKDEDG